MKTWDEFLLAMGMRENSGRYEDSRNGSFHGRYQFGLQRLTDLGLIQMNGAWEKGLSLYAFLHNPALQDACFTASIARHACLVRRIYRPLPLQMHDVEMTLSGSCAVTHLLGLGGLAKWYNGDNPHDGLGTTATEYMTLFAGYDIPASLPVRVPQNLRC